MSLVLKAILVDREISGPTTSELSKNQEMKFGNGDCQ
jgi:hypothetical protein